uniref:Uncharacterized protein n=1 Tax=Mesocestoides corti TaxID=53468 RepID=A0A5K3FV80_MESCO
MQSVGGCSIDEIQPHASADPSPKQAECCMMSPVGERQAYATWDCIPRRVSQLLSATLKWNAF